MRSAAHRDFFNDKNGEDGDAAPQPPAKKPRKKAPKPVKKVKTVVKSDDEDDMAVDGEAI